MTTKRIILFIFAFAVLIRSELRAQVECSQFYTFGSTNVSEGFYIKTSLSGQYTYRTHTIGIGGQIDLLSSSENRSPVFDVVYTKRFPIESFPIDVTAFFMYNRFSELLYETDYGVLASAERRHWTLKLGTSFRTFGLTKQAVEDYSVTNASKIRENFNTMYSLSIRLKPKDHVWNIGITMSNCVDFLILQETNPLFYIETLYQPKKAITLFIDAGYMNAGAFNLSVNPFGYYFKTGIQWKLN